MTVKAGFTHVREVASSWHYF